MLAIQSKKKNDYNTKVNKIEKKITDYKYDKYITTPKFNKLTAESFAARLTQANLVTKRDFDNYLSSLDRKLLQIKQSIYLLKKN